MKGSNPRAVAVGGGTGLPRVLRALLDVGCEPTAIVTMADDGGSSGRLRDDLGVLPPGDVRNCLVALGTDDRFGEMLQYRFERGEGLEGHALGNLLLAALADLTGDYVEAVATLGSWLGAQGRVLPSTLQDVRLAARDRDGARVEGQAVIARNPVAIAEVFLEPEVPEAHPATLDAIAEADLVVVGPGSLYTSILPNFLVGGVADALRACRGERVYVCNVANERGETLGLDADEHVEALVAHGLEGAIDTVLVYDVDCPPEEIGRTCVDGSLPVRERIEARGLRILVGDFPDPDDPRHHDPARLADAFREVL